MLVRRCAWHKQYRGHGRILGVASWKGWDVAYSDGMCADCAARTRAAWHLPASTSRTSAPRLGIPWATAAVTLATAAVIAGIVTGPVEQAVSPPPTKSAAVAEVAPRLQAPPLVAPGPAAPRDRAPRAVAAVTVDASAIFGPGDARALASRVSAARGRIARARGRSTAPAAVQYRPEPEPVLAAALADIDAEWSPNEVVTTAAPVDETPAALPHAAVAPRVDAQAP